MTTTHSDHVSSSPDSCTVLRSPLEPACQPPSTRHRTSPLQTADSSASTHPVVDVLSWLTRATLDIIGEAGKILIIISHFRTLIPFTGFGYSFHSLPPPGTDPYSASRPESELSRAFAAVFSTSHTFSVLTVLTVWFPFLRRFVRPCFISRIPPGRSFSEFSVQTLVHYKRPKQLWSALARSSSTSASPCPYRMSQLATRKGRATFSPSSVRRQRYFPYPLPQTT